MADPGIVRNRAKIAATVNNAARLLEMREAEGSLAAYVWRFEPAAADRPPAADESCSRAPITRTTGYGRTLRHSLLPPAAPA